MSDSYTTPILISGLFGWIGVAFASVLFIPDITRNIAYKRGCDDEGPLFPVLFLVGQILTTVNVVKITGGTQTQFAYCAVYSIGILGSVITMWIYGIDEKAHKAGWRYLLFKVRKVTDEEIERQVYKDREQYEAFQAKVNWSLSRTLTLVAFGLETAVLVWAFTGYANKTRIPIDAKLNFYGLAMGLAACCLFMGARISKWIKAYKIYDENHVRPNLDPTSLFFWAIFLENLFTLISVVVLLAAVPWDSPGAHGDTSGKEFLIAQIPFLSLTIVPLVFDAAALCVGPHLMHRWLRGKAGRKHQDETNALKHSAAGVQKHEVKGKVDEEWTKRERRDAERKKERAFQEFLEAKLKVRAEDNDNKPPWADEPKPFSIDHNGSLLFTNPQTRKPSLMPRHRAGGDVDKLNVAEQKRAWLLRHESDYNKWRREFEHQYESSSYPDEKTSSRRKASSSTADETDIDPRAHTTFDGLRRKKAKRGSANKRGPHVDSEDESETKKLKWPTYPGQTESEFKIAEAAYEKAIRALKRVKADPGATKEEVKDARRRLGDAGDRLWPSTAGASLSNVDLAEQEYHAAEKALQGMHNDPNATPKEKVDARHRLDSAGFALQELDVNPSDPHHRPFPSSADISSQKKSGPKLFMKPSHLMESSDPRTLNPPVKTDSWKQLGKYRTMRRDSARHPRIYQRRSSDVESGHRYLLNDSDADSSDY